MPTVIIVNGYRLFFYSQDCDEPPHIHVEKGGNAAKYWLWPLVQLSVNRGFSPNEIDEIRGIIIGKKWTINKKWKKHCK